MMADYRRSKQALQWWSETIDAGADEVAAILRFRQRFGVEPCPHTDAEIEKIPLDALDATEARFVRAALRETERLLLRLARAGAPGLMVPDGLVGGDRLADHPKLVFFRIEEQPLHHVIHTVAQALGGDTYPLEYDHLRRLGSTHPAVALPVQTRIFELVDGKKRVGEKLFDWYYVPAVIDATRSLSREHRWREESRRAAAEEQRRQEEEREKWETSPEGREARLREKIAALESQLHR
jgi:hypothetical protein